MCSEGYQIKTVIDDDNFNAKKTIGVVRFKDLTFER